MTALSPRERIEREIIGCLFLQPDLIPEVPEDWFDDLRLAEIFGLLKAMFAAGEIIHYGSLWYKRPTDETLGLVGEFRDLCDSPHVFPQLKKEWLQMVKASRANIALMEIQGAKGTPGFSIQKAIKNLEASILDEDEERNNSYPPERIANNLLNHLEAKFNLNGQRSGLTTGYDDLDRYTDGLQLGENSILAARPSVGKTALACNLVERICLQDKIPTLFISLEMSAAALSRRLLSCNQRIEMNNLRTGKMSEIDFSRVSSFNRLLKSSPLYIEEGLAGLSASRVAGMIRSYAKNRGVKFVVVDYLQKIRADTRNEKRTYEVAETSGILTGATKESNVAMLCLAQLNREGEKNKGKDNAARRPRLSDLSDSGQIERDADNVFLLHKASDGVVEMVIGKQRDGETGLISFVFLGQFCRFESRTYPSQPDPEI